MQRNLLNTLMAAALCSTIAASAANAQLITQDVVRTKDGLPVYDTNGGCVRTKWEGGDANCADSLSLEQRTVYFAFDSAKLDAVGKAKLDRLAGQITGSRSVLGARIVGYADPIGDAKYNLMLSKRRAEAVAYYLASKGVINTSVADVRALGEKSARATCPKNLKRKERIACLAPDRRVEVELVYSK